LVEDGPPVLLLQGAVLDTLQKDATIVDSIIKEGDDSSINLTQEVFVEDSPELSESTCLASAGTR
jgi:hypothetical protein